MDQLLFIGSACADVVIRLPHLPVTQEDVHISSQSAALGGCACNAFRAARLLGADALLFAPVGSGMWGDWVRGAMAAEGFSSLVPPVDEPNGCCYCFVEDDGERTFLSDHGAEYRFRPEWFELLAGRRFAGIYICGLEIEEPAGESIISWLEQVRPERLYFAPGPRIRHIKPERMARLLALHPVLHLNEQEACSFACCVHPEEAAQRIHSVTGNDVVITLGERGTLLCSDGELTNVPGCATSVSDTIGAGDSHIGALMAGEAAGLSLTEAAARANRVSAAVVSIPGAAITPEQWRAWQAIHPEA